MTSVLRIVKWLTKALVFFALFAFALNNPHAVTVHWFFGQKWTAPLVLVLLATFTAGIAVGVLGMLPGWWARRRDRKARHAAAASAVRAEPTAPPAQAPAHAAAQGVVVPDAVATPGPRDDKARYAGAEHGV
jgi:lipopolysaccharide assembly protein A